jgi:tetratricopeptide (TPR) repeat protein
LTLGLFPLKRLDDDIVVRISGEEIYRERLKLGPEQIWRGEIPTAGPAEDILIEVGDKLRHEVSSAAEDPGRPLEFRNVTDVSAEGLFLQGRALERERRYIEALEKFMECLDVEPLHVRALSRTAEIYDRRGEPLKALEYAGRALRLSMYDPEANYVFGIAARRAGRLVDAKESLGWAARSPEFRTAARLQLAEIAVKENRLPAAEEEARKALDSDAHNVNAIELLAVSHRLVGAKKEAVRTIARILDVDPLNHLARFEKYLISGDPEDLEHFQSLIRNELPHETYLELAAFYTRIGLRADATTALRNAPRQAEVLYWLAYLLHQADSPERETVLDLASEASPFLVYPFREEAIPIFQMAVAARPSDWKPKYYLGLIYWGKGRFAEARDLFEMCEGSDFAPFYLTRGTLFEPVDPERALADYQEAVRMERTSWRAHHRLTDFHLRHGRPGAALASAREAVDTHPGLVTLRIDLVKALIAEKAYREAASILEEIESLPYEGASGIHRLYQETHVALGLEAMRARAWESAIEHFEKSKLYPERLGTGAPFYPDFRLQDYMESLCYDRLGRKDEAEERRKTIYDYTILHGAERTIHSYFGGLILRHYGKREDRLRARELMSRRPPAQVLAVLRIMN